MEDFEEVGEEDFEGTEQNNSNDEFDARDITEMVSEGLLNLYQMGKNRSLKICM